MATRILLKRSSVTKVPPSLSYGELAYSSVNGNQLYIGNQAGTPVKLGGPAVSTQTGNYTIDTSDSIIQFNLSTANVTATLPSTNIVSGQTFTISKIDNTQYTVTISGTGLVNNIVLSDANESVTLAVNGSSYYVVNSYQNLYYNIFGITAAPTLIAGLNYRLFTTLSAPKTITLPSSPSNGQIVEIIDDNGTAGTNNITIAPTGTTIKINGTAASYVIGTNNAKITLIYDISNTNWHVEELSINSFPSYVITNLVNVTTSQSLSFGVNYRIFVNTASAAVTITLPSSPTDKQTVEIVDSAGYASTNNITITLGGTTKLNGTLITAGSYTIRYDYAQLNLIYDSASQTWFIERGYVYSSLNLIPTFPAGTTSAGNTTIQGISYPMYQVTTTAGTFTVSAISTYTTTGSFWPWMPLQSAPSDWATAGTGTGIFWWRITFPSPQRIYQVIIGGRGSNETFAAGSSIYGIPASSSSTLISGGTIIGTISTQPPTSSTTTYSTSSTKGYSIIQLYGNGNSTASNPGFNSVQMFGIYGTLA